MTYPRCRPPGQNRKPGKDRHTKTRAARGGESDPIECAALRLDLMRQVSDGTATPRVVGPAQVRCQRLGRGVNAVGRDVSPEWKRADRRGGLAAVRPSRRSDLAAVRPRGGQTSRRSDPKETPRTAKYTDPQYYRYQSSPNDPLGPHTPLPGHTVGALIT
jgi:hypothetical protein